MGAGRPRRASGPNLLLLITLAAAVGFVALLGVLVYQGTSVNAGSTQSAGPRLAVDRERIDLGRVVYDKTVRAVFTVSNVGDKPLQIADRQIAVKLVEGC